ncbi:MAG: peptide ABC transporter substrate-binding protein [Dictyoglomus sp. NZ13-RE01]|nr:MAG: peptide ABC transporter substrate-binding protein [Dictyoglomus sp. NZ13-RE01]
MKKLSFTIVLILLLSLLGSSVTFSQILPNLPRNETLIVDALHGRLANPKDFNFWKPGVSVGNGTQQMLLDGLWYLDPQTGKTINALAQEAPIYDKDFKKMTVKLRKGIYWSDGKPFTADDVVFTVEYLMKNPGMSYSAQFNTYVSKVYKTDDYTVVFELKNPTPAFHHIFTSLVYSTCYIMPKHIFEKVEDPLKFEFNPPVSLGPYVLKDYDPQGYWWLFERRNDWRRTSVGLLYGMPRPKYVLFIYYGPDEKKVIAQTKHELDLIFDLTPEAWEVLRKGNPYSRVWYKDFPWAWMDDVRARIMAMNLEKFPYNNKDVRWALTLAIDIVDVVTSGFGGISRVNPLYMCATQSLLKEYYAPLEDWLKDFALEDGFKPWDPTVPYRIADFAKSKGYKIKGEPREIFGYGWWKYAPDEAEKLLVKNGFKKVGGKWYLPDGKPWKITITAPANFEIHATRLAFAVADQWRKFGIDTTVETVEAGPFWTKWNIGDFDVGSYWAVPATDVYPFLQGFHSKFYKPTGEVATTNQIRWKSKKTDDILDKLVKLQPEDPKAKELVMDFIKVFVEEMPHPITIINLKFSAQDHYYWTNYPSADNPYMAPVWWWGQFKFILPFIRSTGRK